MRDHPWRDIRFAFRTLRRSPAFTLVATIILALGIGVSAGVFSAADTLLLRALPYAATDRVVSVSPLAPGISMSKATLERLRERLRSFESVAGFSRWGFMVRSPSGTEFVQGAVATAEFFSVLGLRAHIGRAFAPGDDAPGRGPVVVLSYGYWQRNFGASPSVIGTSMTLNGTSHTIVGVMGPGVNYPASGVELWTPTVLDPADSFDYASAGYLLFVARLRPGVSVVGGNTDLRAATQSMRATFPDAYSTSFGDAASVVPLRDAVLGSTKLVLLLSLGAVGLVLLIACANVGNLVIARSSSRLRDIAVRTALGASRRDVVTMVMTEMMLLGLAGGLGGIVIAVGTSRIVGSMLPSDLPGASSLGIDGRAIAFTTVLSLVVGLVCGLLPAVRLARMTELAGRLKNDTQRAGDSNAQRTMGALLVIETATAVLLAAGAGLMLQTVWRLAHENTGFQHESVAAFGVVLPPNATDPARQLMFYDALHAELARLPGVVSVGAASPLPFSGSNQTPAVSIDGASDVTAQQANVDWRRVSPGYFTTMQIGLVRGRMFGIDDGPRSPPVALVNETFARQHFADRDPVGQRIRTVLDGGEWAMIIGVVRDTKVTSLTSAAPPQMYRPISQRPAAFSSFVVRSSGDLNATLRAISTAVHAVDRDAVSLQVRPLQQMLGESFRQRRTLATVLTLFATMALVLASCGVAALAGYRVAQRRREIAVRMALGARPAAVAGMIVAETMALTAVGSVMGIAAALGGTKLVASQLHGVQSFDVATFTGVVALLCATAIVAAWAPARRAARVDPASALRGA